MTWVHSSVFSVQEASISQAAAKQPFYGATPTSSLKGEQEKKHKRTKNHSTSTLSVTSLKEVGGACKLYYEHFVFLCSWVSVWMLLALYEHLNLLPDRTNIQGKEHGQRAEHSFVPRPRSAFHRLQYKQAEPGNEAMFSLCRTRGEPGNEARLSFCRTQGETGNEARLNT